MTSPEMYQWLETQVLAEHSKAQTMRLVRWVGHDAGRLQALMEMFLGQHPLFAATLGRGGRHYQYVFTQRSSWTLRYVAENAPELLQPWIGRLVENLCQPGLHDAIKRNTLNVMEVLDFPASFDGELADLCFGYLNDPQEPIAIRCASMTILEKICRREPELKPELRLVLEEHMEHSSAGFKSRARKLLGRL